jgi:phosphoribosylglycinamide formyltransferase 1
MTTDRVNCGVLVSGRGSNLEALLDKERAGYFQRAHIACVVSNVPNVRALEIARNHDVPGSAVLPKSFPDKVAYETEVVRLLRAQGCEYVLLAGYMRIVGATILTAYPNRILNIHPSLLPAFPGLDAQRQALAYGVKVSGCTVHVVDAGMDTGPIVVQKCVPVLPGDTDDTLCARILEQEHVAYAEALKLVTENSWSVEGRTVRVHTERSGVA